MEIIITSIYILLFVFLIYKLKFFKIENVSPLVLSLIFVIKIIVGVILTFVYIYYYNTRESADIFKYFDDGEIIFSALKTNPVDYLRMVTGIGSDAEHLMKYYNETGFWIKNFNYDLYNDNRTVIRFNAIIRLISFGYFHVHTVFMCFLSFAGLTAIFKTFFPVLKQKKILLLLSVYFIPSVIFWSSGILKEGILLFAFGLFIYTVYNIVNKEFKKVYVINLILTIFLLLISKFYILIAVLPGIISYIWVSATKKKAVLKFLIVHCLFIFFAFNSHYIIKTYNFPEILSKKQQDFNNMVDSLQTVGSVIKIPNLEPEFKSFVKNSPIAFFNTLFRPHIFEAYSLVTLLAAIENMIIIIFIIFTFFFIKKNISDKPLLYLIVSYSIILFILCGLTTPVMGALVRYKVPALPFLFIILLFILDIDKLNSFMLKIKSFVFKYK
ncbi:MAG: hypothetical protein KAT68_01675 [Bacteroidales bacterium]|nr:hypothetical protein [Bacteroidales bacterium]